MIQTVLEMREACASIVEAAFSLPECEPIVREITARIRALPVPEAVAVVPPREATFQERVNDWLLACFGETIARDRTERNHRFLEEALEVVQAGGCTASEAHQLVDYVFNRPVGEIGQEIGGAMNTLAALCLAYGRDIEADGNTELARCWTKIDVIRAKQAAKPKNSPLPQALDASRSGG